MPSKPIRRPGRLRAVWLTFWTRPLCWMFLIVLLLFSPGAWQMWTPRYMPSPNGSAPSRDMVSALPRMPNPAPHAAISLRDGGKVRGKEPDWSKLRSLTLYRGLASCAPLWTPGAMPLLEHLTLSENPHDHQIARLCELYDLKSLTVTSAGNLTDIAMESLAAEPQLQHLHLAPLQPIAPYVVPGELPEAVEQREANRHRLIHNAASLKWPASLQTLFFGDVVGTPQVRFEEWQRLPQLKTLITRIAPTKGSRFPEETVETLRRFPRLQRFYLQEYGDTESELSVELQRLLPRVSVRPVMYDPTRGRRASVVLVLGMIFTLMLALQMSVQFVTPASLLMPRYARTHVGFAATIWELMVTGSFLALLLAESSTIAALGLCGGSIALFAVGARLMRRISTFPLPGFANVGFAIPCVIFPILGLQFLVGIYGAEVDWFLRGQHPWVAVGLFVVALWGAVDLVKWHIALPRLLEEGGCANVPLSMFDAAGWMEWGRSLAAIREASGKKSTYALRSRDAELDRFAELLHERRRTNLLALWRLGNVQSTMRFMLFFVALFIPFAMLGVAAVNLGSLDLSVPENASKILWPVMGQMVFMLLLFPFLFAWQRRSMMSLEFLRPVDRRDWIRTWFRGIAGELVPLLLVATTLVVLAWKMGQFDDWTLPQLALTGTGFVASVTLIAAIGLWLLTTTSIWWVVLVSILMWLVAVFTMVLPILLMGSQTPFEAGLMAPALSVAVLSAFALAACRFVWWRWQRFEVGRLS